MSDRGIGIAGKHVKTIRSLEEIRRDVEERKKLKKEKRAQLVDEGYEALTGGVLDRTHEVDIKDPRKMTPAELLVENRQAIKRADIFKTIESYNKQHGKSVISPEFLAKAERVRHPELDTFRYLAEQHAKAITRDALRGSETLRGDSYLSDYAKDSEMQTID